MVGTVGLAHDGRLRAFVVRLRGGRDTAFPDISKELCYGLRDDLPPALPMSVAFRREQDDEHLEPKFELPIPHGPNLVTARGLALIETRLAEVEAQLTPELSEEERKKILRDARYWRHQAASAQVVPTPDGQTVAIGTVVAIEQDGKPRTIEIVGHDEADPQNGRLVFSAPLARALMDAEEGEEVEFPGPGKNVRVTAIAVRDD